MTLEQINNGVLDELRGGEAGQVGESGLATSQGGPLWYRGMASNDEALELAHVNAVLDFYDADRIVVGHTPGLATIVPRFGARVLVIDSGLSAYYGGHLASLTIEGDRLINTQRGEVLEIPQGEMDRLPYFESVLELEAQHLALLVGKVVHQLPDVRGRFERLCALFGAGLARPLEGAARATLEAAAARRVPPAPVDVPSGLSGDTGFSA